MEYLKPKPNSVVRVADTPSPTHDNNNITSQRMLDVGNEALSSLKFLLRMARNFEDQGNLHESIKSAESALILRKVREKEIEAVMEGREEIIISASSSRANTPRKPNTAAHARPESPPMIVPGSVREQAKELVLRCNSYAVSELNKKHFESSNFFLNKALFLTDNGAKKTPGDASRSIKKVMALTAASPAELAAAVANTPEEEALTVGCFAGFEEDRLRLRASTYNNLGCMDRRRGKLAECLDHLRQAIHIEVRLDPSTAGSASTYLNLCTVLNEMQRHGEAVVACERAIAALQLSILEQPEEEQLARTATMLVVGLYNLGVSLERRARPHDDDAAHKAYQQALDVARRYLFGPSCGSVEEALDQIKRMTEPRLYQAPPPPDPAEVAAAVAAIARANATPLSEIHALEATTPGLHSDDGASPPMPSHTRGSPLDASSRMSAADSGAPKSCDDDGNGAAAPPTQPPTQELFVRSLPVLPTMAALKRGSGAAMSSTTEHSGHIHTPMSAGNPPQHASTFSGFSISQPNTTRSAGASSTGHHQQQQHVPTTTATGQELLSFHSSNSSNMAQRRPLQLAPLHSQSIGDASSSSAAPLARQLRHDGAETLNTRSSSSVHLASFQQGGGSTTNLAAPPPPPGRRVSMSTRGSISAPPVVNEKNPFGRRTFGSTSSISTTPSRLPPLGNSPSASITSAMSKQSPQAAALEEKRKAAARSKRLQEKVRHNTRRRQEKEVAEQDGAMAEVMYEQMLQGMREGELRRCYNAATQIQRVWRGVMARSLIRSMMQSVVVLQRVVRRHLTKVWEERRRAEEERQRLMAERQRLQLQSARKIQARVRQFLRRVQIRREYLARQSRSFYAARVIQRGYRAACQRRRENLAALAEAQRREDEQRAFRERVAARRIQLAYHQYRGRRVEFAAIQEKQRRSRAATAIQALVRGVLARAWFRYYRAYRRDQELRSAVNVRRLVLMQSAMRAVQSYQLCREKEVAQLIAKANLRLFQAATKIQTMWRQHVAFIHLERLRADKARLDRQAIILQRWLRMCVIRSEYIRRRDARRREAAAITIQVWVRARWQHAKEKAFAEYHAKLLKAQQLERLRQSGSRVVQACCLAKRSALIVGSMMKTYQKHEKAACVWQRVARGYDGRREVALDLKATRLMRQQEREHMFRTVAARVIQRAWRCAMAKDTVERMRREAAAAAIIARSYRIYRAKMELHALRDARLAKQQEVCARKIQRIVRAYLIKRKAREMDAYYRAQHIRKMERQRREEVATIIQALWRGYTTRKAVQQEVEALHGLASYAVKIQRAWRNHFLRCNMKEELLVRGEERQERSKAVLKLQCFWRKMAAAERVARLRETNAQRQHSAVVLQCWWRGVLARRVRAALLRARDEEERVALFYASKWEKAVGIVNAFLRARRCQLERVENIRLSLLSELTYEQQEVFKVRHSAATRIQAMYRGHYERVYVRGVRRERAAEHLLHTALAKKQQRAALRLQCAYRSHVARKEVGSRMAERRAQVLATHEKLVETADTRDVVKELFWVHAATDLRNNAATRLAKIQQQQDAVRRIITCYRGWCARRRTTDDRLIRRRDRAAKIIQEHWKQYIAITTIKAEQRKQQAALEIQRRVRGWLVRKNWAHWRHQMEADRRMHVMADDVYDGAATRLQSFWRRVSARRHTQRLRESRQQQKELEACNEAATVIQEAFRTHYAENSPRPDN